MDEHVLEKRQRVVLLVEYNGASFCGSQFQSQGVRVLPTIQAALQQAVSVLNLKATPVILSGRTDAGVHAQGQVAHFDLLEPDALRHIPHLATSLNAVLPQGISVKAEYIGADLSFHSRASATHRWYRYMVLNRPERSALMPVGATWMRAPLDVDAMQVAAQQVLGTHNFKSFKCPNTPVAENICTVAHSRVHRDGELVIFDIVANRFLYKMVRNLMGALLNVGKDAQQFPPESLTAALTRMSRHHDPVPTAKPEGLTLMAIQYPAEYTYFPQDLGVQILKQTLIMESKQDENLFRKVS